MLKLGKKFSGSRIPYHPLFGRKFKAVAYWSRDGERRVYFHGVVRSIVSIPLNFTSLAAPEPFLEVSSGRSHFQVGDLLELSRVFGLSRVSYYQTQVAFRQEGLFGLLPDKRGPRHAHELTPEVIDFVVQARSVQPDLRYDELAQAVKKQWGVRIHPRTLERVLARQQKNGADQREGLPEIAVGRSPELVDRYEELRSQALGELGRGFGMVVFLREVMKAWMDAWMNATLLIRVQAPFCPAASIPVPQGIRDEAILVLSEIALRVRPEVNPW